VIGVWLTEVIDLPYSFWDYRRSVLACVSRKRTEAIK
jgi:hypothetical protein